MTFTFTLINAPELHPDQRAEAERRFAASLERAISDPVQLRDAFLASERLAEAGSKREAARYRTEAMVWKRVYEAACIAGFAKIGTLLGEDSEAGFEVKLDQN